MTEPWPLAAHATAGQSVKRQLLVPMRALALLTAAAAAAGSIPHGGGGCSALAGVAAARCVPLDDASWSLHGASSGVALTGNVTVPTDAHGSLLAAGVIDDIYFRFNDERYAWVAADNWTFSRPLPAAGLPGRPPRQRSGAVGGPSSARGSRRSLEYRSTGLSSGVPTTSTAAGPGRCRQRPPSAGRR